MARVVHTTIATMPCVGIRVSGEVDKESSVVGVRLARNGAVVLAESVDITARDVDDEASPVGEGLCEVVPILSTGGALIEVEEVSLLVVAVCTCSVNVHKVHWYVDEGHPGSSRFAMPYLYRGVSKEPQH